jgi:hypothetical protein
MIGQYLSLIYPMLLTMIPGGILVNVLLSEVTLTAENIGVFLGLITIMGSILVVYVRNETRAAVQSNQIDDIRKHLGVGDTQMEGLKRSVDGLRLTMERLITLEEARSYSHRLPHINDRLRREGQHDHAHSEKHMDAVEDL